MGAEVPEALLPLIAKHRLPWEALPTWALRDPAVWNAMVPHLGLTALIRNLGNMTEIGAIKPMGYQHVTERLADTAALRKSRVHPFAILQAMAVYGSGHGIRGGKTWQPVQQIIDALDGAFYGAFENVEPTGKRIMLALDVSGSMGSPLMGSPLRCRAAAAAMALVTMACEKNTFAVGFTAPAGKAGISHGGRWGGGTPTLTPLPISGRQRLDDTVTAIARLPMGGTDCALPMLYAMDNKLDVDAFVIYTDNETWAGAVHPVQALQQYRKKTGIRAKCIVVGMTSTGFSIADPADGGMLDLVGFDNAAPAVIADFIRS
jgi:60 kDa SS-A/Ro ribonucleoprotein